MSLLFSLPNNTTVFYLNLLSLAYMPLDKTEVSSFTIKNIKNYLLFVASLPRAGVECTMNPNLALLETPLLHYRKKYYSNKLLRK